MCVCVCVCVRVRVCVCVEGDGWVRDTYVWVCADWLLQVHKWMGIRTGRYMYKTQTHGYNYCLVGVG